MIDSLDCLRHDTVISGNNKDCHVSYLRASRTHCRERFMTRCVKECNYSVVELYAVSAYVLCDTARFIFSYACMTDCVKKRCLTVVNVTHYNNYRRTRNKVFLLILMLCLNHEHILFCKDNLLLYGYSEIITDKLSRFKVYCLILRSHNAKHHKLLYNLCGCLAHL